MNQPPTGGSTSLMQSGQRSRERLTRGQNAKSGDSVTLLSAFVLVFYNPCKSVLIRGKKVLDFLAILKKIF
jgi:hypothetical protein